LFATTDPHKLPVTVLSRCLQFNLKRLPVPLIAARLAYILDAEQVAYEAAALQLLARAADGSMRDGLSLLDQLLAFGNGAAREAEARAMLGTVTHDHVERMTLTLADSDAAALLAIAEELEEFSPNYGQLLDQLASLLERVALYQLVPDYPGDDYYALALLQKLAAAMSPEDVQLYYQTAILGRRDLALAPDPRTGFRMTLIRMLAFRPEGAGQSAVGATRAAVGAPALAAPPTIASPAAAADEWGQVLGALDLDGPTRELARNCALVSRAPGVLRLMLDPHHATARTRTREEKLAQALGRYFGEALHVEFVSGETPAETPAQAGERAGQAMLAAARSAFAAEPTVQALQQRFGATMNPDSVRPRKPS
jgi:DNA polymerase III subunit gamma/tau